MGTASAPASAYSRLCARTGPSYRPTARGVRYTPRMMRPDAYIARFDSSITSSQPAVGTIAAVCRGSPASGRPDRQPAPAHDHAGDRTAQQRQQPAQGDDHRQAHVGEDQRDHQDEVDRDRRDLRAGRGGEHPLRAEPVELDARGDSDGRDHPEPDAAGARVARQRPVEDHGGDEDRRARDQEPGGRAHERVQALRDHEHARALLALGGARHRADGGARHAVAQHQQIAGERRHQPVRAQLGHLEAAGQERHDHEQRQQAGRLGDLLERARRTRPAAPRLGHACGATIRTESAGRRLGFTLPDRSDDPPPAATSSGSERTCSCRGHPQARDPRRPRRDDGLPGRGGGARRHGRQPRTRLRLRRLGALAHQRARRPRDGRGLPRRDARAARTACRWCGRRTCSAPASKGRVYGPRADAPLQRALRRARPSRLAVRRPRPGLARAARPEPAPAPARHQHRRRLLASLPRR